MAANGGESARILASTTPEPTLYVVIPPSLLFAAHWSFFLPDLLPFDPITKRHEESSIGRRIHVSGDRLNGFHLEIIREYEIHKHRGAATRRFPVALVLQSALYRRQFDTTTEPGPLRNEYKDEEEGGGYVTSELIDSFERFCVSVDPPGPSLNRVTAGTQVGGPQGRRLKEEVKDCQWWIRKVVEAMTNENMLLPLPVKKDGQRSLGPLEITSALPVH